MSPHADAGSATAGDETDRVANESSPHADGGQARVAVAGPDGLTMHGGELREVTKKKKKKKRNNNSKNKRKKKRGTGFEEYFCDPPMTLEEYNEEQNDLYPAHRPFPERIQECIQRFRVRRHMTSEQNKFFSRYLLLGGVDATQRQFQGTKNMTKAEQNELTKSEMREVSANDVIQRGGEGSYDTRFYNPEFPEHWDVDFAGIAAGYLSEHMSEFVTTDMRAFKIAATVVSNFLKCVDRHDVCPEYSDDIHEAIDICDQAMEEIPSIMEVSSKLPGDFNTAAATLFCKGRKGDFECDNPFDTPFDEQQARTVFGVHVAILLDREQGRQLAKVMDDKGLHPLRISEEMFEIVKISLPSDAALSYYKQVNRHLGKDLNFGPCGSMTVVPTSVRDGYDRFNPKKGAKGPGSTQVLYLEADILQSLYVGSKIEMVTCTLVSEGFKFIKYIRRILPSFYNFLPQELMFHFREPTMTTRPAPSIHDGDENEYPGMGEDDADDEDVDYQKEILENIPVGEVSASEAA